MNTSTTILDKVCSGGLEPAFRLRTNVAFQRTERRLSPATAYSTATQTQAWRTWRVKTRKRIKVLMLIVALLFVAPRPAIGQISTVDTLVERAIGTEQR